MRSLSLKYQLVVPFALLILLIPMGTGWMLYRAGAGTVDALIRRIQQESVVRINEATEARLAYALKTLDSFASSPRYPADQSRGATMPSDHPNDLEARAWSTLQHAQESGTYVCFGGTDGRFVGLYRINSYLYELYRRLPDETTRQVFAKSSANSPPTILRSDDFDPRGLRALIETSLARLPWPQLDVAAPDTGEALAGFSGEIRDGGQMSALRERLAQVVDDLRRVLAERLDEAVRQVCAQLDTLAGQLQEVLTQSLAADLERLRAALADKARQVDHLQALLREIDSETDD